MIPIWHGSSHIVEKPQFGFGRSYNDYGRGFYCTESLELAKEWACTEENHGYANKYSIHLEELKILNLSDPKYSILNWLALLVVNRQFHPNTPVAKQGIFYLKANFLPDISIYDIVIGYRADDSYFSFAHAFVNNALSVEQLANAQCT